jgi:phosphoribosylformylglycinamidine cyclo-ligase
LQDSLHGFVHITGGGIADNTVRVLPDHLMATYDRSTWALPAEMEYLAQIGKVPQADMERTWNAGIGMSAILAPLDADRALRTLSARGMKSWIAGVIGERTGSAGAALVGTYQLR